MKSPISSWGICSYSTRSKRSQSRMAHDGFPVEPFSQRTTRQARSPCSPLLPVNGLLQMPFHRGQGVQQQAGLRAGKRQQNCCQVHRFPEPFAHVSFDVTWRPSGWSRTDDLDALSLTYRCGGSQGFADTPRTLFPFYPSRRSVAGTCCLHLPDTKAIRQAP